MGDLYGRVSLDRRGTENISGDFGVGERNVEREKEMLINSCVHNSLG